jgi:hypothetical protein
MKVELRKHISEILLSLQIPISFEVYNCNNEVLPKWTEQLQLTHEFLVCCEKTAEIKKLQSFLGKPIFEIENHIYWFDGNRTVAIGLAEIEILPERTEKKIDCLKTRTALPAWLDDFIFDHLNAEYAPDFKTFGYNLDSTKEDNLKYLGTYFPRSYAESFCIFDNIFQNMNYQNTLSENKSLNILSVGCGTGGDLIGLLTIVEKYCHNVSEIKIWAIDGNEEALEIFENIIRQFRFQTSKIIELHVIKNIFPSILDVDLQQIKEYTFDFILSFKMICEIILSGAGSNDNSYFDFVMKFTPLLSSKGLCLLLDVTTKAEHNNSFNPILMNWQVNQALLKLEIFQTLLPLPCNFYEQVCMEQCFTQQKFQVSHKQKTNDISKVCYRVIGRVEFINRLVSRRKNVKYILQTDKQNMTTAFCPHSIGEIIMDGYKLIN